MNETGLVVPRRPASAVRPASYGVSLLLILFVLVVSEIAGEAISGLRRSDEPLGSGSFVLLVAGAVALLGLLVVNARWLWATLGNLRFALALITWWAASSVLGTLVVQRVPNQTDDGYARTFLEATGDFLYNASHVGGGVVVLPTPEVQQWLDQQRQLYGPDEARDLQKQWMGSHTARLRQAEIGQWVATHDGLLHDILATVSWLRLPEAFQISVWFKSLLALLCTALVIVVIQRWRGEWRQLGWAMAHLGMVVFCIGASVRATMKVDGFLVMHTGKTADAYERKVDPTLLGKDPDVQVNPRGDASRLTPLDFDFTLNRFKTEYPKHLFVTFTKEQSEKSWLMAPTWKHEFLDGGVQLKVAGLHPDVSAAAQHRERPDGHGPPALVVTMTASWLSQPEDLALVEHEARMPPDHGYVIEYRRASDSGDYERLLADASDAGELWAVYPDKDGVDLGAVRPGASFTLADAGGLQARVLAIWPDWAQHAAAGGAKAQPGDPAIELQLIRDGAPVGRVAVLRDRMEPVEGAAPGVELRFDYESFSAPVQVKYRLLDAEGRAPVAITFRDGAVAATQDLRAGDELTLGTAGDRIRYQKSFEHHLEVWHTGPGNTTGMTPEDVYYASLPTEVVLEARGSVVEPLAKKLSEAFANGNDLGGVLGIESSTAFEAGDGQLTVTPDGRGLLVRLVSDAPTLGNFPGDIQAMGFNALGLDLPFRVTYATDEQGQPLRFTSDVTLSKDGKVLKRALVEPNAPIYMAGFQFSQADFKHEDPTYSGFGVVRDPSVHIVYFGMSILVLGVILLFYVSPMIAKRKARKTS